MSKYYAKGAVRSIKNFSKGYSDIQAKVRAATSNDPWGPSGTAMNEIAEATHDHHFFIEIMEMIDKRLNDKGKNWRHVFKALILLDYCLHAGSDNVVLYAKDNLYIVKTLREFIYVDEHGKDQGANVRQRANEITNLLQDDERLKTERRQRATMRDRISGRAELPVPGHLDRGIPNFDHPEYSAGYYDDDAELEKAIEESKKSQKEYEKKQKELSKEEEDLAKALQLSEEEERKKEEKRKEEEAARQNEAPLIQGDTSFSPISFQQQQPQTDFFNSLNQQYTGPQFTQFGTTVGQQPLNVIGLDNQQNLSALGGQVFSTNPYQQQLLQLQQQQTNPYQQQFLLQQQTQNMAKIGSNNPFGPLSQQQSQPQQQNLSTNVSTGNLISFGNEPSQGNLLSFGNDPLQLQTQTGTSAFNTPGISSQTSVSGQTPFDSSFGNIQHSNLGLQSSLMSESLLQQQNQQKTSNPQDEKYAQLNNLLANRGEGMDTFGNVGDIRVPTGTGFFNTSSNQTSKNPFQVQQQSTSPSLGDTNKQASLNDLLLQQSQQGTNPYTQQTPNNVFGVYNPNNNSLF